MEDIRIDNINEERSLELSAREGLDNEAIERYMFTFHQLPAIEVWSVEGEDGLLVSDGLHRLQAAKRLKHETIQANLNKGRLEYYMEAAILSKLDRGCPCTRAEKRNCIDAWLKIHTERTNEWIADDLGMSPNTVMARREKLEAGLQIEQLHKLLGKDGKWYPRDKDKLGLACGEVHILDVMEGLGQLRAGRIDLIFADPPYNLGFEYGGVREVRRTAEEYRHWCWQWLTECERVLAEGGSIYVMHYPEMCAQWLPMLEELGLTLRRWISWVYPSNVGHSSRNWTRAHRALLFATKGDGYTFNADADPQPFRNPDDKRIKRLIAEGRQGVTPYDWWEFNLVKNVSAEKTVWENQLPLALVERIVKVSSSEGDLVLDPFMGSGTTAEAAARHGRRWIGFDINPKSSEVTAARVEGISETRCDGYAKSA